MCNRLDWKDICNMNKVTKDLNSKYVTWDLPSVLLQVFLFLEKEFFILVEIFSRKKKNKNFENILMLFNRVFIFILQFDWKNGLEKLKFKK